MGYFAVTTHFVMHRIEPDNTIDGLQWAGLPSFNLGDDPVGNLREHRVGELGIVELFNMRGNISQAHSQPVEANNLIGQHRLAFFNQLWLETALAVLWGLDLEAACRAFDRFATFAIALIAAFALRLIQVSIHRRL